MRLKLDNCVKDCDVNKYYCDNHKFFEMKNEACGDGTREIWKNDGGNILFRLANSKGDPKKRRSYIQTLRNAMNLKLNNDVRRSSNVLDMESAILRKKKTPNSIKEERRRNGRYIAILVGIMLFLLAIYHAWVRRIPVVASLVVPALIMFIYVGWVLYTASRDKNRLLDAEAALQAEIDALNDDQNNLEISVPSSEEISKTSTPEEANTEWAEVSTALFKEATKEERILIKPVILINDKPPEEPDQRWNLVESLLNTEKIKGNQPRRKFKRKFCRSKRQAVFKRSYSIA